MTIAGDDHGPGLLFQFGDNERERAHAGAGKAVSAVGRSEMEDACRAVGLDLEEESRHGNMMHYWAPERRVFVAAREKQQVLRFAQDDKFSLWRLNGRHALRLHMLANELHDAVHGGAGLEDGGYSDFFEAFDILIGNDAADQYQYVIHFVLLQQVHHTRNDGVVRARENRESDDLHVFLERGADDHLRRLAQAGVDDLHAGIAERARDHLGAAVVAVKARLRDKDADFRVSGHQDHLTTEGMGAHGKLDGI